MFANDVLGLCRNNFFTGDVFGTQIPTVLGGGFTQTPYGFNVGTGNIAGQGYHPLYGYLFNRIPQGFINQGFVNQGFNQGFVPQTLGHQGLHNLLPQTFGGVNTIGAQQCLPFLGTQTPFTSPVLAQGGIGNVGYGFSPYTAGNWNWTSPLGGFQSQFCR